MKKIVIILLLLATVFAGCNYQNKQVAEKSDEPLPQKSDNSYLTESQFNEYIKKEIGFLFDLGNENIIAEAANVVYLIRNTVLAIVKEDYAKAIEQINKAIAKAELIEKGNTENVIAAVNVVISQNVQDAESAANILDQIKSLVETGNYQEAKQLFAQLSNEIQITKESISVPEYLKVMKKADELMKSKKYDEALIVINSIMGKSTFERRIIPLPLLRTQHILDELESLIGKENTDVQNINILLNNADYEIRFAELLGYGKSENVYENLKEQLRSIEVSVGNNNSEEALSIVLELKVSLKDLREKVSTYKKLAQI